jgi:hypothetical protein
MSTLENKPLAHASARPSKRNPPAGSPRASREQFIPLRKAELVDTLARSADMTSGDADGFRKFCVKLQAVLHAEYQTALETLKNAYAPFDPDTDTRAGAELSESQLAERRQTLFTQFGWLLQRGNFVRLAQEEIDRALADCSQWGVNLSVDFDVFDRLELYCRGDIVGTRFRRRLKNRLRNEAVEVPIYQRLVVIFRLRPDHDLSKNLATQEVFIKLFKDIPKVDLDMLLPGTQVRLSLLDRVRITLPTLSGISVIIWKILVFATAPLYTSLAFLGLVGGTVGYGVRSLYGYLNTKQKYQLNLTQSLYYQNLDNNAGVIHRLLDEAEEQENREAMLAYFYLWRYAPARGWSREQLDQRIESFLRAEVAQEIDFEVGDALEKLERLELVEACPGDAWKAVPIDRALGALARRWAALAG